MCCEWEGKDVFTCVSSKVDYVLCGGVGVKDFDMIEN